ncbi:hypothetical protein WG66_014728 [Moniliophthora roreri]|uniref:CsbD-like domain-containing protein n=1 Tax=Moniliophthora roreri TaxID=221103 RepID=A0A0W0ETR5_MONRR|nr:hypothetical protein WG66_014728 [Moniliophthora roreri]
MSSNNFDNSNLNTAAVRPEHHVHGSSDPLPGNRGVGAVDYSAENIERTPTTNWDENKERQFAADQTQHQTMMHDSQQSGKNAFNTERPMNVQPTEAGGVAIDGRSELPEGHASATDKLIGKTQKVIGKLTHKPEMHEKGELREAGGKAAATGQARAPHD